METNFRSPTSSTMTAGEKLTRSATAPLLKSSSFKDQIYDEPVPDGLRQRFKGALKRCQGWRMGATL